jgi:hypothetical protein
MMSATVRSIPRAILRDWLVRSEAAPLAPSIRGFMERQFRADFGAVRVHTAPAAAALCRALHAHAFTWGRHIVFDAGQYAPASPDGRRRLAHELVHVLQQRAAAQPARPEVVPVGDPRDECEDEADRLAAEALGAGLRSAITPDAAGVIRRTIRVLADTVTMRVDDEGLLPDTTVVQTFDLAIQHLTRNRGPIINMTGALSEREASAINISAAVQVELGPRDPIDKWDFHFIQLARENRVRREYLGRLNWHGSVTIDEAAPPAVPMKFAHTYNLDSSTNYFGKNVMPFFNLRDPVFWSPDGKAERTADPRYTPNQIASRLADLNGGRVGVWTDMDDHPNGKIPLRVPNSESGEINFLYRATRDLDLVTAFVVRDDAKVIRTLAHVAWRIIWKAEFRWEDGNCHRTLPHHEYNLGRVTKGPPSDPKVAATITNPTTNGDETANKLDRAAINAVKIGMGGPANLDETDSWPDGVPTTFFKGRANLRPLPSID